MHYTLEKMLGVEFHARLNDKRKKIHNCNYGRTETATTEVESIKCNSTSTCSVRYEMGEKMNRKSQNRADQFSIQPQCCSIDPFFWRGFGSESLDDW